MREFFPKLIGLVFSVGLAAVALIYTLVVIDELGSGRLNAEVIVTLLLGAGVFSFLAFGPVGKAMARMLEGSPATTNITESILDLEDRVAEISVDGNRIMELEERLEFAERLLAQRNDESLLDSKGGN